MAKIFVEHRAAPVGVIHVVCWGFNRLWSDIDDGALKEINPEATFQGNERMREYLLEQEVKDFAELCGLLKTPSVQHRLEWLIIAVAKSDVFWPRIDEARDYYIPGSHRGDAVSSAFHHQLGDLTSGRTGFPRKLAIVPFSAHLVTHTYARGLYPSVPHLDAAQTTAMRNSFYDVLARML